uniref:Uncharacterized protein n=1 Tax=Labrus bergylta TaxID=56723 RepID=A0A3Q3F9Y4_9LABR
SDSHTAGNEPVPSLLPPSPNQKPGHCNLSNRANWSTFLFILRHINTLISYLVLIAYFIISIVFLHYISIFSAAILCLRAAVYLCLSLLQKLTSPRAGKIIETYVHFKTVQIKPEQEWNNSCREAFML